MRRDSGGITHNVVIVIFVSFFLTHVFKKVFKKMQCHYVCGVGAQEATYGVLSEKMDSRTMVVHKPDP